MFSPVFDSLLPFAVWLIAALTIGCMLARPWKIAEAWWAAGGAALLIGCRLLPWHSAVLAMGKGLDVYLFLAGMMLLSELARREGVFDWCAALAVAHARGSQARLFFLIYGVGVIITVFLSNDATAVVLTPAVFAVTKAARVEKPLPYLFACALVANAASFVLPISNPANLVLFGGHLPALAEWLRLFALPSLLSIAATAAALYWRVRKAVSGEITAPPAPARLSTTGRFALGGIATAIVVLLAASAFHRDLGAPTLGVAIFALVLVGFCDARALWEAPRQVSWGVIPLVAGLFVIVEAVNRAGALGATIQALQVLARLPGWQGDLAAAFGVTILSNIINNLPSGLITGMAVVQAHVSGSLRSALLIGVDLGPNLSVTGSLATILWLTALRRERLTVNFASFLRVGVIVTPAALILAVLVSAFTR
jgi:arsenical pump membrane protein